MSKKPNLIFIFTDEQRADTLSCYGNNHIKMPNLNRLADESFVFENAYVTQPVCTPSRSSIMTGLYPHTNGCITNNVFLEPGTRTIAEMIDSDYETAYMGKWHLGYERTAQHGFDTWVSTEDAYIGAEEGKDRSSDYTEFLMENGFASTGPKSDGSPGMSRSVAALMPEQYTKAMFTAKKASEFIEKNSDKPFCLYVNYLEPHAPFFNSLHGMYDSDDIPVDKHFLVPPSEKHSLANQLKSRLFMSRSREHYDLTKEKGWRQMRAAYYALCSLVDRSVGKILDTLSNCGLSENTIVVFSSDHGDMLGDHALGYKCTMFEEAARVPMLVKVPWISKAMNKIPGSMSQVDLVPTLLELMGQNIPEGLEGNSLADVINGKKDLSNNDVIIEWNGQDGRKFCEQDGPEYMTDEAQRASRSQWRTIVSADRWKLNLSVDDNCELFDLNNDPHELVNRFDDPAQRNRIKELKEKIEVWQKKTNDTCPLPAI